MANIVKTEHDFKDIQYFLNQHFYLEKTLPNQVFKEGFERFSFEIFHHIVEDAFWDKTLQPLCKKSGDQNIFFSIVDEGFSQELVERFNFYFASKISVNSSSRDYDNCIGATPKSDPSFIAFLGGDNFVFVPESGKWAIYADRGLDLCILAFKKDCDIPTPYGRGWWLPVKAIIYDITAPKEATPQIPKKMKIPFLKNYGK